MLNRRQFSKAAMATGLVSAGSGLVMPYRPLYASELAPFSLEQEQSRLDLGVTIGTLVGAAIGIAAYTIFTQSAPGPLVGVFAAAVGGLGGATLTVAAQNYIDFEVEQASGDLILANKLLRQRIASDGASFKVLADHAVSQSRRIERLHNDASVSVRIIRREMHGLRQQVEQMRAEGGRAQSTSSTYAPAEDIIDVSRLDPQRQADKQIALAMNEAQRCKDAYQDLVGQVMSNS